MLNSFKEKKTYTELMELIKKQNLELMKTKENDSYRLGNKILTFKKYFTDFSFKKIRRKMKIKKSDNLYPVTKNYELNTNPNYFSSEKIIIYTAVFGNYDNIKEPLFVPDNCEFIIFTDQDIPSNSLWKKFDISKFANLDEFNSFDNILKNRYVKMNPHLFFNDCKYSIYIDGNVQVLTDLTEYIQDLGEYGIGIHQHFKRDCVYEEVKSCLAYGKITKEQLNLVNEELKKNNVKPNFGLYECCVIVREHNNTKCVEVMEAWWDSFKNNDMNLKRDQILLILVLNKMGLSFDKIKSLGYNVYTNPSFRFITHK